LFRWIPAIARLIKWGDEWVDLYRAVSAAELADIQAYGGFRPVAGGFETGKWSWRTANAAGSWIGRNPRQYDVIVKTSIPKSLLGHPEVYTPSKLDGIGDAGFVPTELLPRLAPPLRLPIIGPTGGGGIGP